MKEDECALTIATVGQSKSLFIQAIDEAENGEFQLAHVHFQQGEKLLDDMSYQQFMQFSQMKENYLYLHIQNHIAATEIMRLLASKFIKLYEEKKG